MIKKPRLGLVRLLSIMAVCFHVALIVWMLFLALRNQWGYAVAGDVLWRLDYRDLAPNIRIGSWLFSIAIMFTRTTRTFKYLIAGLALLEVILLFYYYDYLTPL